MKRILVIGSPGAGKSTFSKQLAAKTGLPLIHLDDAYWQPGWMRPPTAEWEQRVEQLIAAETWILDGNYTSTLKRRAALADEVIVLTYPRLLCLYRAITRALLNRRPDQKNLGREPLNREFLSFIWHFPKLAQGQVEQLHSFPHLSVVELRSDTAARRYLHALSIRGD
ncbi:AAA family ATPase [Deinococcus aquatilis]|uniref:AAA family ATPase n=1 Tax=Deinococcus aquatilis TaxID=519440 RepID=UPI000381E526|nr:AAA family ATPase [Deinococcus aquatilis]